MELPPIATKHIWVQVLSVVKSKRLDRGCLWEPASLQIGPSYCYWTQDHLLTAQKSIIEDQESVERKGILFRKTDNLGRKGTLVWDQLQRFCSAVTIFKGKKGKQSQLIINVGNQILCHFSIECRSADFRSSFGRCLAHMVLLRLDVLLPVVCLQMYQGQDKVESQSFFKY